MAISDDEFLGEDVGNSAEFPSLPLTPYIAESAMTERFLIVGLGNPGREYRSNRHNIGFMLVDRLAAAHRIALNRVHSRTIIGLGSIKERPVVLAKPQTFMNNSGMAVGALSRFYKIPLAQLLVIFDDLDLTTGSLRLRSRGGAGGHNGMRSIIAQLGEDFPRLRLGIGRPPGRMDPAAYVLQDFTATELPVIEDLLTAAVQAVETYVGEGVELAMTRHNNTP